MQQGFRNIGAWLTLSRLCGVPVSQRISFHLAEADIYPRERVLGGAYAPPAWLYGVGEERSADPD